LGEHGVGGAVLLMVFAVGTEWGFTVLFVVEAVTDDEFPGTKLGGDARGRSEIVEPHNNKVEKLDEHEGGKILVRKSTENAACSFLDDPNPPFNLSNVSCRSRGIHVNSSDVVTYFLKFVVH
jgi:hypothetical protein